MSAFRTCIILVVFGVIRTFGQQATNPATGTTQNVDRATIGTPSSNHIAATQIIPQLTYQGVSVSEWIRLTDDSDNQTRERAWEALTHICAHAPEDGRKWLAGVLAPMIEKSLADQWKPVERWRASECNLMLNSDSQTYLQIAEATALNDVVDKDIRFEALFMLEDHGIGNKQEIERKTAALSRIITTVSKRQFPSDADSFILFSARNELESNTKKLREMK